MQVISPAVPVRVAADGVAWITLDNPSKLNAMSMAMWQALAAALDRLEADPAARCCVVTGEGDKAFCVGADVSEMDAMRSGDQAGAEYDRVTLATLARLQAFAKPTIAMIRGYCLGGGAALAAACDLRIAAAGARFGIPAAKLGLAYFHATVQRLTKLVGPSQAKRLLYTGERFGAEEMLRIGLVDELVPPGELAQHVQRLAAGIAANAPMSLAAAKRAVEADGCHLQPDEAATCAALERACRESEDHAEGRRAFLEKRPPVFRGR